MVILKLVEVNRKLQNYFANSFRKKFVVLYCFITKIVISVRNLYSTKLNNTTKFTKKGGPCRPQLRKVDWIFCNDSNNSVTSIANFITCFITWPFVFLVISTHVDCFFSVHPSESTLSSILQILVIHNDSIIPLDATLRSNCSLLLYRETFIFIELAKLILNSNYTSHKF